MRFVGWRWNGWSNNGNTMEVISLSFFRATSFVWRPTDETWEMVVMCRGTYRLAPGDPSPANVQKGLVEDDLYWDGNSSRALYYPSDFVPHKAKADILLVGYASSPQDQPAKSLQVRLFVGGHEKNIDKSLEVWSGRVWSPDGTIKSGQEATRFNLSYEQASGGPGTDNPVGIPTGADLIEHMSALVMQDPRTGLSPLAIPGVVPQGRSPASPNDYVPPVGFGPIAPAWPQRQRKVRSSSNGLPRNWNLSPFPVGFDFSFFNAAPEDQQLDELLGDEQIVLENVHPEFRRLVTCLPREHPCAFVEHPAAPPEELPMRCDTLWVDADNRIFTLTWRGRLTIADPSQTGRVLIASKKLGEQLDWRDVKLLDNKYLKKNASSRGVGYRTTMRLLDKDMGLEKRSRRNRDTVITHLTPANRSPLPFVTPERPPSFLALEERTTDPGAPTVKGKSRSPLLQRIFEKFSPAKKALPAKKESQVDPDPSRAPPERSDAVPARRSAPPLLPTDTLRLSDMQPSQVVPPPSPPLPTDTLPIIDMRLAQVVPPPPPEVAPPPPQSSPPWSEVASPAIQEGHTSADSSSTMPAPWLDSARPSLASLFDSVPLPLEPVQAFHERPVVNSPWAAIAPGGPMRETIGMTAVAMLALPRAELAVVPELERVAQMAVPPVQLLWFDPGSVSRIRRVPRWKQLLEELVREPLDRDLDEGGGTGEPWEIEDRREVFEVLARGAQSDARGVEEALAAARRAGGKLVPPLVLVEGELEVQLDELEGLKAAATTAAPLITPADEGLRAAVEAADRFLGRPGLLATPTVCEGLHTRIREAFAREKKGLPGDYLDKQVERALLSGRHYQKREVLGGWFLRGVIWILGEREGMLGYVPEELGKKLPMYRRVGVRVIGEVLPRQDQFEVQAIALKVAVVGRVD
jgi:hypothetical protein